MSEGHSAGILTLGCKVNQYESEAIAEALAARGFRILSPDDKCDVYIINTCTVTAESDRKARQFIRRAVQKNPGASVLVTGCLAQTQAETIKKIPGVSYVCGNKNKLNVVKKAVELAEKPSLAIADCDVPPLDGSFEQMSITRFDRIRTYVKIEDGCENRCAYCIIPAARGPVRSKRPEDILSEVRGLVSGGCREIVLTGIETSSWGRDIGRPSLAALLSDVDGLGDGFRVRLGSLDPSLITPSFVDRIKGLRSLTPHFHLSVQSGSSRVLAAMRRKYNREQVIKAVSLLQDAFPDLQLTADVIAGFPGETEEDFSESASLIQECRFLMVHVFPYSRRKGTEADRMDGQIPEQIKRERVKTLMGISARVRTAILKEQVGKDVSVLFETEKDGLWEGHTASFIEVCAPGDETLRGQIRTVRICRSDSRKLYGNVLEDE
ncbi:MAG: tRNA (N(6)-L-threonylcarbamoyladenosine(37)-C(2))-methylthiotransferase MtaB [Clostridia bacterium]|nr:tRNA (N(6)-L-threonylcarbamoyladenosine(37)-C(2))-methylthiotransferase MtaB [Clostridia bacterium]